MKKPYLCYIILFLLPSIIFAQKQNLYQKYLNENNIPIILRDDSIDISTSIEEKDLNKFTDLLFLKMEIILENIYNVNTTRTSNGGPYKRIIIEITNGEIEISEDNLNPKLVYDPIHPDAIKSGPRAGYVEFPAIDIVLEIVDYISTAEY